MTKNWTKTGKTTYSFSADSTLIGTIELSLNSMDSEAHIKMGKDDFKIKRTGFWKTQIEMTDKSNAVIARIYAEKWFASAYILEFDNVIYKLVLRNNPLAEWAIIRDNTDLLAYGLHLENSEGPVHARITGSGRGLSFLLDFLLWYLFVPIGSEQLGDHISLSILLSAQ